MINNEQSEASLLSKGLKNKKLNEDMAKIITGFCDGEPVNKNPLPTIPDSDMRLYCIDYNCFESIDELLKYCRDNDKSANGLMILDYYHELAGKSDVIRQQNDNINMLCTAVDEDGYAIYNVRKSFYRGEFTWEYWHGSIKDLYAAFRDKGVVFENDIYAKLDEQMEHILKYCREKHLFNM